jgi:hypothetical protein
MITLPNQWSARDYQRPFFHYMLKDGMDRKRAALVWHRRSGKDSSALNLAAVASQLRVGTIWHMLPTLNQGRRVIWDGIDRDGRRMIDQAFPPEIRAKEPNDSEMKINLANGSIYQIVGSDNYDRLVGTNPVGVVFSEYSVADPAAWDYLRPILAENGGWAIFIYTPRGKNHGYHLSEMARNNPNWFYSLLTVDDTKRHDGTPVIGPEIIEEERRSGMAPEKIQQEYYCSFEIGLEGSYYTDEIKLAETQGRIGHFPHDPSRPCQSWWDIGVRDANSIIITQRNSYGKPDIIDYFEERNKGVDYWARELKNTDYIFDEHYGPHDLEQREWSSAKTRREIAASLGVSFELIPNISIADGIDATRRMLRVARFNKPATEKLISALRSYRRKFDEKNNVFSDRPVHDWASHAADAMRYLSLGWVDTGTDSRIPTTDRRVIKSYGVKRTSGLILGGRRVIRSMRNGT